MHEAIYYFALRVVKCILRVHMREHFMAIIAIKALGKQLELSENV